VNHRVLVVADVRLFRDGIVDALRRHTDMTVVAAAATFAEATRGSHDLHPDVILIDAAMTQCHETIASVVTERPEIKVIVIGIGSDSRSLIDYAEAGVAGFVPREGSIDDVLLAVERAARGELDCSPRQAAALLCRVTELARGTHHPSERARLTLRESEVLRLIDHGFANKRIAGTLGIELATVKNHVHNILEKLQCRTRAEAAARSRGSTAGRPRVEPSLDALSN
jgi:two-component system, NarL family, nitrate/nitrite response regulator NarL